MKQTKNTMRRAGKAPIVVLGVLLISAGSAASGEVETDELTVRDEGTFYGNVVVESVSATTNSLSLLYEFSESEDPITDQSGNGNSGSVSGAVWTASGKYGGGYSFDGTDDYIEVGDKFGLNGTVSNLTVCAWVKADTTSGEQMIVGKLHTDSPYRGWGLVLVTDYPFAELIANHTQSERAYSMSPEGIGTNEWHFLVGRYHKDESNLWSSISVDGVLMATNACSDSDLDAITETNALWLGQRSPGGAWDFMGVEDNVRIYERWLSDAEITALYYSGVTAAQFQVSVPATITHMVRQGDIEMGVYTNEP